MPKQKVPSVATSDEWKLYYNKKKLQKAQKQEVKEQREIKRKCAQGKHDAKRVEDLKKFIEKNPKKPTNKTTMKKNLKICYF